MNTQDTLLAYSEWLDSQRLIVSNVPDGDTDCRDDRSHDQLAKDFITQWNDHDAPCAPLADERRVHLGLATTHHLLGELMARANVAQATGQDWPSYRTVDQ